MNDTKILKDGLNRLNLNVSKSQFQKLLNYAELVKEGNQWVHLVSKRDENRIVSKHILESLQVVPYLPEGCRCADVGSGAGFPGIPVKIVRPDIDMTLIESNKKKALFLIETIAELRLRGIKIVADRVTNVDGKYEYLLLRCGEDLEKLISELTSLMTKNTHLLLISSHQNPVILGPESVFKKSINLQKRS